MFSNESAIGVSGPSSDVAFTWSPEGPYSDARARAEDEANATLIAAAPDLLRELVMVYEWATVEKAPLRAQEIASIKRAIAKAGGR